MSSKKLEVQTAELVGIRRVLDNLTSHIAYAGKVAAIRAPRKVSFEDDYTVESLPKVLSKSSDLVDKDFIFFDFDSAGTCEPPFAGSSVFKQAMTKMRGHEM